MTRIGERKKVEELRKEIRRHEHLYYVATKPEISDFAFDQLMAKLRRLEETHPELVSSDSPTQRVGGTPLDSLRQVQHATPMLSLDNSYNEGDLEGMARQGEARARARAGGPGGRVEDRWGIPEPHVRERGTAAGSHARAMGRSATTSLPTPAPSGRSRWHCRTVRRP